MILCYILQNSSTHCNVATKMSRIGQVRSEKTPRELTRDCSVNHVFFYNCEEYFSCLLAGISSTFIALQQSCEASAWKIKKPAKSGHKDSPLAFVGIGFVNITTGGM